VGDSVWGIVAGPAQQGQSKAFGEFDYYVLSPVLVMLRRLDGKELRPEPFREIAILMRASLADKLSDAMVGKPVYIEYKGEKPGAKGTAKIYDAFLTEMAEFRDAMGSVGAVELLPDPKPARAPEGA
jgi:hypothetical protein